MADDLEKFVLQYEVDVKDTSRRLEELNEKIDKTNKAQKEGRVKDAADAKKAEKEKQDLQKRETKAQEAALAKQEKDRKANQKRESDDAKKVEKEKKDAQARKEKEQEVAAKKAKKAAETTSEGAKTLANDAADELARLVPGVDKVTASVTSMGSAFGVAGAAIAVLAAGITSVMNLKEQYDKQRQTGMDVGVSAPRIEEYQRKFQKYGEGRVSRDQTIENVRKINDVRAAAYKDPTRMGEQARIMRLIGINVGNLGEKPIGMNELMGKLGQKFAGGTEAQAQAIGAQFGLSQDFTSALRKMGGSVGQVTETSEDELRNKQQTNKNLDKFNESLARMNEEFLKASNVIAEKLLPYLTKIVDFGAKVAKFVPAAAEESEKAIAEPLGILKSAAALGGAIGDKINGTKDTLFEAYQKRRGTGEYSKEAIARRAELERKKEEEKKDTGVVNSANQIVEDADKNNKTNNESVNEFGLIVNMFAGAVSSFANAVDEKQAWAAWAGEVGKAAGLRTPEAPGTVPGVATSNVVNESKGLSYNSPTKFDPFFDEAAKRFNISTSLLKRVANVESKFDPNAVSKVGAKGLMQVTPENSIRLKVANPFDPRSNIMAGAEILSENLKRSKGDVVTALRMYHGGLDRSAWGAKTMAYSDKVLNQGEVSNRGESKANINLAAVQANIAQRLGVPVRQIQMGGITKGDVTWTANQKEAELQNKIIDLNRQKMTANLPKTEYDRIARETLETQSGLETLRKYRGDAESKAKEGERRITVGQIPVVVNVTASGSVEDVQKGIRENVMKGVQDGLNAINDGKKL
jgi:hypothetical protein